MTILGRKNLRFINQLIIQIRYLISNNKKVEAFKIIEKIAKINKTLKEKDLETMVNQLIGKSEPVNDSINMLAGSLTFSVHQYREKSKFGSLFYPLANFFQIISLKLYLLI